MKKLFTSLSLFKVFFICQLMAQKPIISSILPGSGPIGTVATITGSNFGLNPTVYFGTAKGKVINSTGTSIQVTVPSGATSQSTSVTASNLISYADIPFRILSTCPPGFLYYGNKIKTDISTGEIISNIETGDIDGDGKIDMVACIQGEGIVVFRNTSSANNVSFAKTVIANNGCSSLALADLDGDGKIDLVANDIINWITQNHFFVYKNFSSNGNITFYNSGKYLNSNNSVDKIFIADMDTDGKLDIISFFDGNGNTGVYSIFRNTSPQLFFPIAFGSPVNNMIDYDINTISYPDITIGDLNVDGRPDIAIVGNLLAQEPTQVMYFCQNYSTPGNIKLLYINRTSLPEKVVYDDRKILIGRFDKDSIPDVTVACIRVGNNDFPSYSKLYSYHNKTYGRGGLIALNPPSDFIGWNPSATINRKQWIVNDANMDGKDEIIPTAIDHFSPSFWITANITTKNISWGDAPLEEYFNNPTWINSQNPRIAAACVADFNGDGITDIIANYLTSVNNNIIYKTAFIQPYYKGMFCPIAEKEINLALEKPFNTLIKANIFQKPEDIHITFSIPFSEKLKIELYDILGRKIAVPFDAIAEANKEYQLYYNTAHIPNGLYTCKIATSKKIITKQIAIIR